jgi:dihydrofolate reductase
LVKCSVFIATSLDGFISRKDGSIDWLNEAGVRNPEGEDYGYAHFMVDIDALVMGRSTFEQVLTFGEWPYGSKPVVVLSSTLKNLPAHLPPTVSLSAEEPLRLVQRLSSAGFHHLYIDGGQTIQGFLAAGLINEITITVIPVLLGSGRPLFGMLASDVQLDLICSRAYKSGFVQNHYRVLSPLIPPAAGAEYHPEGGR